MKSPSKNFSFSKDSLVFTFDEKQKETLDKILNESSINSNIKTEGKDTLFMKTIL